MKKFAVEKYLLLITGHFYPNMDSDDEYIVQQFSDEGGIDSSDDDELVLKEFYKQTDLKQKRSLKDFQAEMEKELEFRVATHLEKEKIQDPTKSSLGHVNMEDKSRDHYFDTDSEEDVETEDSTVQAQSNLELFYDPQMDLKDETYVQTQRDMYRKKYKNQAKIKLLPNSDAVLNCPACFTTLCHDCQR